jgi:hypothetical protein
MLQRKANTETTENHRATVSLFRHGILVSSTLQLPRQQAFAPTYTVQRDISSKLQFVAKFPRTKLKGFEQIRAKPLGYPHYLIFLHPRFLTTLSVHGGPKIIRHIPTLRKRAE